MFGLFVNNIPEIHIVIAEAIQKEKERLLEIEESIEHRLANGETIIPFEYEYGRFTINREFLTMDNISKKEMFKALQQLSTDAKYISERNSAYATVDDFKIALLYVNQVGLKSQITIQATYIKIKEYVQEIVKNN